MSQPLLKTLAHDIATPSRLIPALSSGFVVALLAVVVELSLASLIFSGPLADFAAPAAGLTLFGCFVACLVVALGSGFSTSVCLPEDAPAAIMASVAMGVAASLGTAADPRAAFVTVGAAMALSTLGTGVLFLAMARFGLGSLMRYIPYPVVGGFLAGIGWMLVLGGIGIMTRTPPNWGNIDDLISPAKTLMWLPGAALAGGLFIALRRWGHAFTLPGCLLVAMVGFWLWALAFGGGLEGVRASGLLLGGMPEGNMLWPVFSLHDATLIRWDILASQLPELATIPLVSALSFLLISSGIEAAGRQDLDLNRELALNGVANLLAGPAGSHASYTALSFSMLGPKTGSNSRLVGLSAALFVAGATFLGARLLGDFPRFILGGMVLFLGVATLQDSVLEARRRVSKLDFMLLLSILLVVAAFGFLAGAGYGLVAATVLFAIRYSRLPVLREELDGTTRTSALERPLPHRRILLGHGRDIRIMPATGYLFFGSANVLTAAVAERLGKSPQGHPPPSFLILDFAQVDGFDSSAVNSFLRLLQRAEGTTTRLVFSAAPAMLREQLHRADAAQAERARFFPDLDRALQWCEDAVLGRELERLEGLKATGGHAPLFDETVDDMLLHLERSERFETLQERLEQHCAQHLQQRAVEAGASILGQGEAVDGLLLLVSGQAEEVRTEPDGTQARLRTLSPGAVAGHTGAVLGFRAPGQIIALAPSRLAFLPAAALRQLEEEHPATALMLHSHVSTELQLRLLQPAKSGCH